MVDNVKSSDESWSTSEEDSSGNEYSIKTKQDKFEEEKEIRKSKRKKRKRKHKHKHKKNSHHKKKKKHKSHKKKTNDLDISSSSNDEFILDEKKDTEKYIKDDEEVISKKEINKNDLEKRVPSVEATTNILPALLNIKSKPSKLKKESQTINILPALLNRPLKAKNETDTTINILPALLNLPTDQTTVLKSSSSSGKDLLKDIMKIINDQNVRKKEIQDSIMKDSARRKRSGSRSSIGKRRSRSKSSSRYHRRSRTPSKDKSSRSHRSRSHDKHSCRSKSRENSYGRSRNREKSRSRSRSHGKHRSRSRRSRSRRSRSSSHSRHRSRSRRRSRSCRRTRSRSRSKTRSAWDLKYDPSARSSTYKTHCRDRRSHGKSTSRSPTSNRVDDSDKQSEYQGRKTDGSVFSGVGFSVKRAIDIKISDSLTVKCAEQAKSENNTENSNVYGKWEAYVPKTNKEKELLNLTKLCQTISAKEGGRGEKEMDLTNEEEEEDDSKIYHPFKVTAAPMYTPQMHHRVPTNPAQAIMSGTLSHLTGHPPLTGPLEKHFPVSSGTDHRDRVEDKIETDIHLPVFNEVSTTTRPEERIDVSAVIARRLGAQQILTNNPHETSAKLVLAECDLKLKRWSDQSKKPGKFTGEIGTRMNRKDIAGAIETWVRKDFFHNLQPVSGGIGQRMMEKMGWKEGNPLGKNNEGYIVPIALDVKVGRGGLHAAEEQPVISRKGGNCGGINDRMLPIKRRLLAPIVNVNGKHPVSALLEHCSKNRMGIPEYAMVFEEGQSHSKNFLMKVTIQNIDYQSSVASPNKKHAKAQAAMTALRILEIINE